MRDVEVDVKETEIRCKQCSVLLAKAERDGVTIRRGEQQTTVSGRDYAVSISCYRCRTLNVVTPSARTTAA